MSYAINDTQTVWLPFNTSYNVLVQVNADWNENAVINDPNGLVNVNWTGSGDVPMTQIGGPFTTPSSFGQQLAYPVNVIITNDGGTNKKEWYPSMVRLEDLSGIVWSFDQLNNEKHVNLVVVFEQIG